MYAVKERVKVYFGGNYSELWSPDYRLSIKYSDRVCVTALRGEIHWEAAFGDREFCDWLNSCPLESVERRYLDAAAEVAAAISLAEDVGLPLDRLYERFSFAENSIIPAELMRVLMDDYGYPIDKTYQVISRCCDMRGVRQLRGEELEHLQPRTAFLVDLLIDSLDREISAVHDASCPDYRSPVGALHCGESVRLRVKKLGGIVKSVTAHIWGENFELQLPMERRGDSYIALFTAPEKPVALWYRFAIEGPSGIRWLNAGHGGYDCELSGHMGEAFRLTVFLRDYETPEWFRGTVMYQIFPDRFAFSDDDTAKRGVEYHAALGQTPELHGSIDEPVRYQPRPFEKDYSPDDFYGGTLNGIRQKLRYIKELGVGCIYLNPIVEARSNHRYDASDYLRVDPILGTNEDFEALCSEAKALDMRIMLDGVYSHTGADSRYFNRDGHYDSLGACQSMDSQFYPWYDFKSYPNEYRSWWGFRDLPEVDEENPVWQEFVINGRDSVVKTWLRRGAAAWRLDVADELPDDVLALIRKASKEEKSDAVVLGEVWEDPIIKESYGVKRNYALGYSLDSVMNYPFRTAVLDFMHKRISAYDLRDFLISQQINYPQPMYYSLMNLLGSHDVDRLRSALATDVVLRSLSREEQLKVEFTDNALDEAVELEKLCAHLQFAVPGVPSVYYGDEQGMCGVCDPFNRLPFKEDVKELHDMYALLGKRHSRSVALQRGKARFIAPDKDVICVLRYTDGEDAFGKKCEDEAYLTVVNRAMKGKHVTVDCAAAGKEAQRFDIPHRSAFTIKL